MIQAPLAETQVTTTLSDDIVFDSTFSTTGITSIAAADLIRIDDEVMRVLTVGVGGAAQYQCSEITTWNHSNHTQVVQLSPR